MKKIFGFLFLTSTFVANSQSYQGPESMEYDAAGDRWFVANSDNGEIIARSNSGTLSVFASALPSGPHGLEIVGNTLYACSGSRIRGFDLSTGTQTVNVNLGATFLNGITHVGTDLFITDFSAKKIFRFNTLNNSYNEFVSGLAKSPNGIIYDADDNRLVFVNWGTNAPVMAVNLTDSTTSTLTTTTLGNCDGIAMNCSGQFYVASWSPSRISRFENDFVASPVNMNVAGLSSAADIFYNTDEDTLGIPNSGNNTVTFVQYNDCLANSIIEDESSDILLFPNPTNSTVNFKLDYDSQISIFDLSGKNVYSRSLSQGEHSIWINELSDGLYFFKTDKSQQKLFILR